MSEPRFTNPSTPNKPPRARKRSVKAKATPTQPDPAPSPVSETKPTGSGRALTISLSAIEREAMIQTAAYFRAQRRNFQSGHELEDWLAAEAEIDAALLQGGLQS